MGFECCLHFAEHLVQGLGDLLGLFNVFARQEPALDSGQMCCHLLIDAQSPTGERIDIRFHHQWIWY